MPTISPSALFCPTCDEYVGRSTHCCCGWVRPASVAAIAPAAVLTIDLPLTAAPLAVDNARLIFGFGRRIARAGGLLALDAASGREVWRREFGAAVSGGAALAPDGATLVAGDDAGRLHALRLSDGSDAWAVPAQLDGAVESSPLLPARRGDSLLVVVTSAGVIAHIDWRNGQIVREVSPPGHAALRFAASPVHWGNRAVVAALATRRTGGGAIFALDHDGSVTELAVTEDGIYTTPVLLPGSNIAIVGTNAGFLRAIDLRNSRERWSFDAGKTVRAAPALNNGVLYVGSSARSLSALDAATGNLLWAFEWDHSITTTPTVVDGLLVFADNIGRVVALDLTTASQGIAPQQVWDFDAEKDLPSAKTGMPSAAMLGGFVCVDGNLWCGAANGCIYRLPLHGGKWEWAGAHAQRHERWVDAAACLVWADARQGERRAAELLDAQGEHARAAAVYAAIGQPTLAARAYERAGEQERLPYHWQRAAGLWRELGLPDKARHCHAMAARDGSKPLLQVVCTSLSQLKVHQRGILRLNMSNAGAARACRVWLELCCPDAGPTQPVELLEILPGGEAHSCQFAFTPNAAGDISLVLAVCAEDDFGNPQPRLEWTQVVHVAAADMPPVQIHVERLFTQPATVYEQDAYVINRGSVSPASLTP